MPFPLQYPVKTWPVQVRSIIAKRLLESKLTAPSLYVSTDVQLDQLTELRKTLAAQVRVEAVAD